MSMMPRIKMFVMIRFIRLAAKKKGGKYTELLKEAETVYAYRKKKILTAEELEKIAAATRKIQQITRTRG